MFTECKTKAAADAIVSGPYTLTDLDRKLVRQLHTTGNCSAHLLASIESTRRGFPMYLCHMGTEIAAYDVNGVCTWELS